jgi:hypothetical protein
MIEVNRILKPGGHFVITTPNIAALRGVAAILQGYHPDSSTPAIALRRRHGRSRCPHNREYTPREIHQLLKIPASR